MSINDYLALLRDTPVPVVLVIGGIIFLLFSTLRKVGDLEPDTDRKRFSVFMGVILLALGLGLYLVPPSTTPASGSAQSTGLVDALAGDWSGTIQASDSDFSTKLNLSIQPGCQMNSICGTYDALQLPCRGTIKLVGVEGNNCYLFQEQFTDGAEFCSSIIEHLQPLSEDSIFYGCSATDQASSVTGTLTKQ